MTRPLRDPLAIAQAVAHAIESVGGAYFVGGSVASSLQGDPRSTNDVDFVLSLPTSRVDALADALGPDFEIDRDMLRDALARHASANGFYLPFLTKVDFFGLGSAPFDQIEFDRRRAVIIGPDGESLVVKSPEDSVLRKLLWFREGGGVSDKQWRDIVAILRVSGAVMDTEYLGIWSARLACEGLLARANAESNG